MIGMPSGSVVRRLFAVLLVLPFALSAQTKTPEPILTVALTFDDLPIAGPGSRTPADANRLTDAIVGTLKRQNAPAIGFYKRMGAVPMDDWTVNRLTGPALERMARGE